MPFTKARLTGTRVDKFNVANQASNMGGLDNMADDRMKNDDAQRNMGGASGQQGQGQQSPGRSGQQGGQQGQQAGGQQGGQQGGQKDNRNIHDDEEISGGQTGGQKR